jgi:hypothetical protein
MSSVELKLHPLLKELQRLIRTGGDESSKLEAVMQHAEFRWAAVYVITDTGQIIFKMAKRKKEACMEAFGGATDKPSNFVFTMSKLRSELADESSITITEDNLVRMSPLMVVRDGLVQIAMLKQAWVDTQKLWVPESARKSWHWVKSSRDDITGFWEELRSAKGDDLRARLESGVEWKIFSKRLEEALECTGTSFERWRECDLDTLRQIVDAGAFGAFDSSDVTLPMSSKIRFLATSPWCTEEVQALMNSSELLRLRQLALIPATQRNYRPQGPL